MVLLYLTRGRAGAEVITSGTVLVTGQEAVSAFAARLLGLTYPRPIN